jgi:hypothetical protein
MIVAKYGNYVRKFMWQLCGWGRVVICMTFHKRAFDLLNSRTVSVKFFLECTYGEIPFQLPVHKI